jgi:hypothetical protein
MIRRRLLLFLDGLTSIFPPSIGPDPPSAAVVSSLGSLPTATSQGSIQ